ncbi:MAG: hypothetical protein WDA26_03525, partial [Pusillimonas sp.]
FSRAGLLLLARLTSRGLRTSWLMVGMTLTRPFDVLAYDLRCDVQTGHPGLLLEPAAPGNNKGRFTQKPPNAYNKRKRAGLAAKSD